MANTKSLDLESSGSDQYASIADASQTGLDLDTSVTIEAWVKIESSKYQSVACKGDNADDMNYELILFDDETINFSLTEAGGSRYEATSTDTINVGEWTHIAATFDESNVNIYINSVADSGGTISFSHLLRVNSNPFYIGARGGATHYFDGLVDEVRIWNDVRTQQEIEDNYEKELVGDEAGLAAYWKFNDSALDETSNDNDLSLSGSPSYSSDIPNWPVVFKVSDDLSISDNITALRARLFSILDNTANVENITVSRGLNFVVSDDLGMSDLITALRGLKITVSDVLAMSDEEIIKLIWTNLTKNTDSYSNESKSSDSYDNKSKSSDSWTNKDK